MAVAGLALLLGVPEATGAQEDVCRRWRDAFAGMPMRTIRLEAEGRVVRLPVKVADTAERRVAGFQCATPEEIERHLILFDFGTEVLSQFHMQNVPAALDTAFAKADGRVFTILRMEPSPTALYGPLGPFRYALEARAGFFESQGLRAGAVRLVMAP
jgi:hypothetical protein